MSNGPRRFWFRELTRYHWFVFLVASLGWLFDTMDQQLFNSARKPAMQELLARGPGVPTLDTDFYGGLTTAIFLIGWASGGIAFGILGDRLGRAKTMMLTILIYSIFTGFSAFSRSFWDFALYRFLTGLGVGGEFAVGVALVAEVMPEHARPFALGLLQALSAVGNVAAALITIGMGHLEQGGLLSKSQSWRLMFVIGTVPALLALLIRRRLKEPERWQEAVKHTAAKRLGSYAELFGDPRWRRPAIVGVLLATSGVMGAWGIGFFITDFSRSVFRKVFEQQQRQEGEAGRDRDFVRLAIRHPEALAALRPPVESANLLSATRLAPDAQVLYGAIAALNKDHRPVSIDSVLAALDHAPAKGPSNTADVATERMRRQQYLAGEPGGQETLAAHAARIAERVTNLNGRLTSWTGYALLMFHIGAFLGMYSFSILTHYTGRRPAFAMAFIAAMLSTAMVFAFMETPRDVFWMVPLMGFCQLSLFGGYAIYFPELFPTRLRSTGTSFCYNVGRYLAAPGPLTLGYLTSVVFHGHAEPMRYAGVSMCLVFLVGLLALPFAPETRGQPLPE